MKIVFVNRFFFPDHSATSQILTDLAFYLAKAGVSICVLSSRQVYDDPEATLPAQANISNVQVTRVWTTRFGRQNLLGRALDYLTFYLSAAWSLLRLLRQGDIVIAKTDPPLISVVAGVVAKVRGAKLINWIQDLFPEVAEALGVGGRGIATGFLRSARNWSLRIASRNVVIGNGMAMRIAGEGINPDTIAVIPNWSDGCAIYPVEHEDNDLRREWNLQDSFVVGYSGNLGRAHEFETILGAAENLKENKRVVFLFIGGGTHRDRIENEGKKRGLTNILFKPYQPRDQLAKSLSVPDVHLISLHPSMEGLIVPSKFYGVAAAGRPTLFIGSKSGEIPLILQEAGCGYSVEIGQVDEASRILREVAVNTELCIDLGKRARALFDQRYDARHAMNTWDTLLASMANPIARI
jgi:colanic acid biosynthesis glycosyl transferase WcaI